ncbi:M1 family metallopeptidase [Novosphingopyxis sp.]|uniref:M1 family metallopeptidase n=1 Tax=Novosphingopyxis sp. TaxID=2709690 RepID=UPI003B5CF03A
MRFTTSAAALLLMTGMSGAAIAQDAPAMTESVQSASFAKDVWTYADPETARVSHVDLDLVTDFEGKQIYGTAVLDIAAQPGADHVVLDDNGLRIQSITDMDGGALPYTVGKVDEMLGAPLTVQLNGKDKIRIAYASAPGAEALQWLPKEATAGGEKPYLFSQGQPINNRSWIPTQDSPGIRQTWDARITVPKGLVAVMSGDKLTPDGVPTEDGRVSYRFRMNNAVPPYLIALAVGDLAFKSLGPNSGVYTEPALLDAAADEFQDVEKMIAAAEDLYGPYRWGRYDMLVLPPSFPYGGMENPTLTFLTPTIITGDRSNTDVVAHELAHSWSGNLVTNATWSDSWLNEGFTTYFENRIMEAVYGKDRAALYADLDYGTMLSDIAAAGGDDAPTTRLHGEPGATAGQLDYFKGSTFLRTIEQAVGRDRFDAYLRGYFDRFAFQPQTTAGFLADLRANLIEGDTVLEDSLKLDQWAYAPGLPDNAVHIHSATLAEVDKELAAFNAGGPVAAVDTGGWSTQQWMRFLRGIPKEQSTARLKEMDGGLNLSNNGNAYVRSAWYEIAIANRYEPAVPSLKQYLTSVGRMLLIRPLYQGLEDQGAWGHAIATDAFAEAKAGYHPMTAAMTERILAGPES